MSKTTAQLISAFESLPASEKRLFIEEIFRRMPPFDSGPLCDEQIASAGDALAAELAREEHDTPTR